MSTTAAAATTVVTNINYAWPVYYSRDRLKSLVLGTFNLHDVLIQIRKSKVDPSVLAREGSATACCSHLHQQESPSLLLSTLHSIPRSMKHVLLGRPLFANWRSPESEVQWVVSCYSEGPSCDRLGLQSQTDLLSASPAFELMKFARHSSHS